MSWYEALLWLAGIIAAVGTVYGAYRKIIKPFIDGLMKLDVLIEHDRENYLAILRLQLMNDNLPVSERIIAGDKYIKAGGNGDCKHFYLELLKEHTK